MRTNSVQRFREIELGDEVVVSAFHLAEARKKLAKKQADAEEKMLSLPAWMRETLKPVPSRGMTRAQRELLSNTRESSNTKGKVPDKEEWVEEGSQPGELKQLAFDPFSVPAGPTAPQSGVAMPPLTSVDGIEEMPIPKRFEHLPAKRELQPVRSFNSLVGEMTAGIYRTEDRMGHRINLDEVAGENFVLSASDKIPSLAGGIICHPRFVLVPNELRTTATMTH